MIQDIDQDLISNVSGEPVNGIENRLDHCAVTVSPPLNPDHESIEVPEDLLRSLSITGKASIILRYPFQIKILYGIFLNNVCKLIRLKCIMIVRIFIHSQVSHEGAEFSGAEMIYNYERLLRQVIYTNGKPAYYLNRQFKIACSELNGRFVSNEYVQTVSLS